MKTVFTIFVLLFQILNGLAQQNIGIGTTTPHSTAILDASSTEKGILVPRMNRTQRNAIVAPAKGLLIFQDDVDSVGFHFYNGTRWIWILGNDIADTLSWKRNGNPGTVPGMHFIGTTDLTPLLFKTNSRFSGKIDPSSQNVLFGQGAGEKLTPASGTNLGGKRNTYFGHRAGVLDSLGFFNVFIGNESGLSNDGGTNNAFLGYHSGSENTTGSFNTFLGSRTAKSLTTGTGNTVVGAEAGDNLTAGDFNVIIGYDADVGDGGLVNATAIGARSRIDTSNAIVLGSIAGVGLATASTNVGIGTSKPKSKLHIVRGGVSGGSYLSNSLAVFENNANSYIQLLHANEFETGIVSGNASTSTRSALIFKSDSSLQLRTGGNSPRLTIDKTGRVGIGMDNPRAMLHVFNSNSGAHMAFSDIFSPGDTAYIKYQDRELQFRNTHPAGGFWQFQDRLGNQQAIISTNGDMHMNGSLTVMRFSGINVVSPLAGLHIKGFLPSSFDSHIRLETAGALSDYSVMVYDGDMKFRNFGAGDNFQWRNASNNTRMVLTEAGDLSITGTLTQGSDVRLKKNLTVLQNPINKIHLLNGYQYFWIDSVRGKGIQTGFIAQDVEKIIPELVKTDTDGMKSVNYIGLIPYLVESIKELKREIEKLSKERITDR